MQIHTSVTKRAAAIAATAATCAAAGLVAVPAQAAAVQPGELAVQLARPTRIGPVTGLTASATKPAGTYSVKVDWDDLTGATAYDVSMIYAGTVLAKTRVTPSSWTTTTTRSVNDSLTFKVVPVAAKRKGVAATTTLVLPDLTAPVGQYDLALDDQTGTATVTELSLTDDMPGGSVTRYIDWGMDHDQQPWNAQTASGWEPWTTGSTTSFTYPELGRWEPRICVVDQAGNARVIPLRAVVTGDLTPPSGTFTTTPQSAWAKYTKVVVTEGEISDNFTPADKIVRSVNWGDGDGNTWEPWTAGTTLAHVYTSGGTHTPVVRLVDEAGKSVEVTTSQVTVKVDATAPKVTVRVPKRKAAYVSSWKTLRGTARDSLGTGVRQVQVRVVQKRGTSWYAYRAPSKRWVRAGSTRTSAMRQTRAAVAVWKQGRWSTSVARLRRGTIVVAAQATDRVGNASKRVSVKRLLTRW